MENEIEIKKGSTPAEMISLAVQSGADLEKLEKLLTLQERWEAGEAKKVYNKAMADFKADVPLITKDKVNSQYNSKYTSLNNLVNTVNPILSKHGLSASWNVEQNGTIKVTCKITHALGHSEESSMSAEADTSGAKNKIQQIKSTVTYLKSVTFESICGLAATDANLDDDGKSSETKEEKGAELYNEVMDTVKAKFPTHQDKINWFKENKITKKMKEMDDKELNSLLDGLNE